jgi:hypothetical protein
MQETFTELNTKVEVASLRSVPIYARSTFQPNCLPFPHPDRNGNNELPRCCPVNIGDFSATPCIFLAESNYIITI